MSATPPIARMLRIHGRVQGVGFRQSLRTEAKSLGVTGWVRNRSDGSVEALVQGDLAPVEALIDWARRGPRGARVDRVDVTNNQESGQEKDDFRCHPTI